MWKDPIVEEIRRCREEYAGQFNYDLHAICEDLRSQQSKDGRKVVSLPPKRISKPMEAGDYGDIRLSRKSQDDSNH